MAFQNQRNIFAPLAEGLRGAAQAVGAFFAQKAEREWQQGVDAIAQARNKLAEIEAAEQDPDFAPDDNQVAFLNQRKAALEAISGASPREAAALWTQLREADAAMGGGFSTRNVIQAGTPATPQRGGRGGVGRPAAPGEAQARPARQSGTPSEVSTVTQAVPFGQMFAELQREAGLRERGYQESLVQSERDFILLRDREGREHEVNLQELDHLHQLKVQQNEAKNDADRTRLQGLIDSELARLASKLRTSELGVQAAYDMSRTRLEQRLTAEREADARTGAISALAAGEALTRADQELAIIRDPARHESERQAAYRRFQSLVTNNAAVREAGYTLEDADAALTVRDELARDAAIADLNVRIEQGKQAGINTESMELQRQILQSEVSIAGNRVTLSGLEVVGARIKNETDNFNLEVARWEQSLAPTMTSQEYVQRAIELGNTAAIEALIEEFNTPGTNPHLRPLLEGVTLRELNRALETASEVENLEGRKREYAEAEIDAAFRTLQRGDVQGQLELVDKIASLMTPEQIGNDLTLQTMVSRGLLTQAQLDAAVSRSNLRLVVERDTVNGPKIQRVWDRLASEYSGKRAEGEDVEAAEQGLRAALNELVEMEALSPDEVEGMVALYKQSWSDTSSVFDADLANSRAHTEALRAQAASYRSSSARDQAAADAAAKAGPVLDAQTRQAIKDGFDAELEALNNLYPGCGESKDVEGEVAIQAAGTNCDVYRERVEDLHTRIALTYEAYNVIPPPATLTNDREMAAHLEQVKTDFGPDAAQAEAVFLFAMARGYNVDTFVAGVDDPNEWMSTWGSTADELELGYDSVIASRDAARNELAEEHRQELFSNPEFQAAYQRWRAQGREPNMPRGLPPEELAALAQQFEITPGQLNRMFGRAYAEEEGGLAAFATDAMEGIGGAISTGASAVGRGLGYVFRGDPNSAAQAAEREQLQSDIATLESYLAAHPNARMGDEGLAAVIDPISRRHGISFGFANEWGVNPVERALNILRQRAGSQ